jgi:glycosyltransferase involved in cell wall biosynthesis
MRVALVSETWLPEINGVSRTLARLADGLGERGHAVDIVRPRQRGESSTAPSSRPGELCVPGLPIPGYGSLRFGLPVRSRLLQHWQQQRPDIVHIATEGPLGMAALAAARRLELPVSSSFHTNFDAYCGHYGVGWLRRLISAHLRRFHNRADLTLVPTRALAEQLARCGYQRVGVLARGIDMTLFHPLRRSPALRQTWGVGANQLVVAYVGRLAAEKNLGLVLAAFAAIRQQQPDARLLFVGDGPARAALQAAHPEHLFAGMQSGEDLARHYASADLFLMPSLTETFGNTTLEALASGLGVVAFDQAAAAELIEDGITGCRVPPGDAAAFIAAAATLAAIHARFASQLGEVLHAHRARRPSPPSHAAIRAESR